MSVVDVMFNDYQPSPDDLINYLPWACRQLEIEEPVFIIKVIQYANVDGGEHKNLRRKSKTAKGSKALSNDDDTTRESALEVIAIKTPMNAVKIYALYDKNDDLVQLQFDKNSRIPQSVMKVLTLILPFQPYLQTITFKGQIDKYTIPELSNIIISNHITDITFDGIFLSEANFYLLFDFETLRNVSLARCRINDRVLEIIALKMIYPLPASKSLQFLNLSSNFITDAGAKFLGQALRSNRQIYYLNLSGNRLTDIGAAYILDSLLEFPMKIDESVAMKTRYIEYLKKRNEFLESALKELNKEEVKVKPALKSKDKKGKSQKHEEVHIENTEETALARAGSLLEGHHDPFLTDTVVKEGMLWSKGNNTLCYLNVAYNDLTYFTITKLVTVLKHQRSLDRKPKGLVKVAIQGNRMPYSCQEITDLDDLFELSATVFNRKQSSTFFGKRRASLIR